MSVTVRLLRELLEDHDGSKAVTFTLDLGGSGEASYEVEQVSDGWAEDEDGDRVSVVRLEGYSS